MLPTIGRPSNGSSFDSETTDGSLFGFPLLADDSPRERKKRPLVRSAVSAEALPAVVALYPLECIVGQTNEATQFRPDPPTLQAQIHAVTQAEPSAFARTFKTTNKLGGTLATTEQACELARAQGDLNGEGFLHREIAPLICDQRTLDMVGRKRQLGAWRCEECHASNLEHVKKCCSCKIDRPFFPGQDVITPFGKGVVVERNTKTGLYLVALGWKIGNQRVSVQGLTRKVLQKGVVKAYLNQASMREAHEHDERNFGLPPPQEKSLTVRYFTLPGSYDSLHHFSSWLPPVVANDRELDIIQLSYAGLGDQGAVALGSGIEFNNRVHTVNMCGNNVGEQGARALGRGMAGNSSVVLLNLEFNDLGNAGVVALLEGLVENIRLEELRLDNNGIDMDAVEGMAALLSQNRMLKRLSLTGNKLSRRARRLFVDALECNHLPDGTATFEVAV